MWPSHWFLLTLGGLVPAPGQPDATRTARSACGSRASSRPSWGCACRAWSLVVLVDWRLRPEHPDGEDPIDVLIGWASFGLLPVFGLVLCALPALDAHTRLLFGRRLEYRVTEKVPVQARFRDEQRAPSARSGGRAGAASTRGRYAAPASISSRNIGRMRPAARPR